MGRRAYLAYDACARREAQRGGHVEATVQKLLLKSVHYSGLPDILPDEMPPRGGFIRPENRVLAGVNVPPAIYASGAIVY